MKTSMFQGCLKALTILMLQQKRRGNFGPPIFSKDLGHVFMERALNKPEACVSG